MLSLMKNVAKKIALVCPSSPCYEADHPPITQQYLKEKYNIDSVYNEETFTNMSAQDRAAIFLNYLQDPTIDFIWQLRGGEGSADLIPYFERHRLTLMQIQKKPMMGFSDFTALLIYFSQEYEWPVFHGPGALRIALNALDADSEKAAIEVVFGGKPSTTLEHWTPLNNHAQSSQRIEAKMIGGTLSLLNISIKDIWEINCANKIVMIEEINEKPHVVMRTLKYLKRIGCFEHPKAIVFGDVIGDQQDSINRGLEWFASQCEFPVFKTNDFGHGSRNMPFSFNQPVLIPDINRLKVF